MDEETDLALLDQHLLKTNQLGQRMTNILGQLDNRLYRLDKAIVPLGIQPLTRKDANIDALLSYLSGKPVASIPDSRPAISRQATTSNTTKGYSVEPASTIPSHMTTSTSSKPSSHSTTPTDDVVLLARGPDIMALGEFFSALDKVIDDLETMYKGLMEGRGGAREAGVKDLTHLVETGFRSMTQLFLKLSKEGMGRTFDVDTLLNNGPPTPPNLFPPLNTLLPLTTKMTVYLSPANPTPKTLSIIQPIFEDAISQFATIRGDWMCRSMNALLIEVEEADEGGIWEGKGGRGKVGNIMNIWEAIMHAAEGETMLAEALFPNHPPQSILTQTLASPLTFANKALSPTLSTLKKYLSRHTFTALDLYASVSRLLPQWDHIMSSCLARLGTLQSPATTELVTALDQPVNMLRSLSLRSFPEMLADVRSAKTEGPPTSAISDVTYSTISYLESLMEYEKVVEGLLGKSKSERSWLMGLNELPSSVRSADEEGGIVKFFVADVLGTLLNHLHAKAKGMKRPIGQAFLLNNASHIRNMLIIQSNSDITGPGAEAMLNKAVRDARTQFVSEFQSLTSLLISAPHSHSQRFAVPQLPTSERHNLKESSIAFFERLGELEGVVTRYPLNRQDPEMRDSVGKEVEGLVRKGYEAFATRCQSKGAEKYVRSSPDEVSRRVQNMFR
ncbi:hypothetical protein I312_103002 [Cryptococcus bacillisporus CA1280]|uniref:Exocyst complex protein EXO70 n=1 Tax=Cryptococcus bacillisporus CA1280 TaxID=1296109 RepID=A0A0D0U9X2_CRYGA|nr:hypothetical protein I312_05792 [Cryptococcus bacillisporus CA1280]